MVDALLGSKCAFITLVKTFNPETFAEYVLYFPS